MIYDGRSFKCKVSSVKSGKPGMQPSGSSYLKLDFPTSAAPPARRVLGTWHVAGWIFWAKTRFSAQAQPVFGMWHVAAGANYAKQTQFRPRPGDRAKQSQFPASQAGTGPAGQGTGAKRAKQSQFHRWLVVQTNPISGSRDIPPFHYSIIPALQSDAAVHKQTKPIGGWWAIVPARTSSEPVRRGAVRGSVCPGGSHGR